MGIYYGGQNSGESGTSPNSGACSLTDGSSHSTVTSVSEEASDSSSGLFSSLLVAGTLIPPALIPPTITPESTGVHYFTHAPPTSLSKPCTGILDRLPPELNYSRVKQVSQDQGYGTEDLGEPIKSGLIRVTKELEIRQQSEYHGRPIHVTEELAARERSEYHDRPIRVTEELAARERSEYHDRPIRVTEELETREWSEYHDRQVKITEEFALETRESSVPKDSTLLPQQLPSNYQNYDHASFPYSQSFLYSTADVSKHDNSSPNPTFLDPSLGLLDTGQYDDDPLQNLQCFSSPHTTINESKEHLQCFSSTHTTDNESKVENLRCFLTPEYESNYSHTSSSMVVPTQLPVMPLGNTGFCAGGVVFSPPDDRDPLYRRPDWRRHYSLGPHN